MIPQTTITYVLFSIDLPPNACLDDLASLLTLDAKNLDIEKLGADAIKEQQCINLKFSSDQVAVIPEDHAQCMLAGVSQHTFTFERIPLIDHSTSALECI